MKELVDRAEVGQGSLVRVGKEPSCESVFVGSSRGESGVK